MDSTPPPLLLSANCGVTGRWVYRPPCPERPLIKLSQTATGCRHSFFPVKRGTRRSGTGCGELERRVRLRLLGVTLMTPTPKVIHVRFSGNYAFLSRRFWRVSNWIEEEKNFFSWNFVFHDHINCYYFL